MSNPKVLVGVPVSNLHYYCFKEFIKAIKSLTYPNYDILLVDNSKTNKFYEKLKTLNLPTIRLKEEYCKVSIREKVTESHNQLRKITIEKNYDYLLLLDQDVIPPKDILEKLVSHNKKLIAGLYFGHHLLDNNETKIMPFAFKFKEKEGDWSKTRYLNDEEIWNPGLIKIAFSGGGCILIHKDIFKKIKFRYDPKIEAWDDRWLGYDAYKNGFDFYLDNTVKCKHLYLKRPFKWQDIMKTKEY